MADSFAYGPKESPMLVYQKLLLNALLAGFWAGLAAFSATQELSKTALLAAGGIALRTAAGVVLAHFNKTVPVDK